LDGETAQTRKERRDSFPSGSIKAMAVAACIFSTSSENFFQFHFPHSF